VIGFNALKNPEVEKVIRSHTKSDHWEINNQYSFGGYAKINLELIHFMNAFYQQYQIPLDPIYTGKMLFAIFDLVKAQQWKWGKRILIIHTGGLQGIAGMNLQLQKKKLPLLSYTKDLY
jgi:1-aminocyclopropane-1-carboxylate deaminase